MKLQGFGDEIVFDEISASCQKAFLTTLVNLESLVLPETLPNIYTSETLKAQLFLYFESEGKKLNNAKFHILKPFVAVPLRLNNGTEFEVLPCMPEDSSTSFMLTFRKGLQITHIYGGFASEISSTMVNLQFAKWLRASGRSIDYLYVTRNTPTDRCVDCEFENTFENIERHLQEVGIAKLLVRVPLFGCEVFIEHLASEYRGHVAIDGILKDIFALTPKVDMKHFTDDFEMATIVISYTDLPLDPDCSFETTVKKFYANWSPLPSDFELDLLARLVRPKNVLDITDINSYNIIKRPPVHITKYSFNDENTSSNTTNKIEEISLKKCHCPQASVNHNNYMECLKSVVLECTEALKNLESSSDDSDNDLQRHSTTEPISVKRKIIDLQEEDCQISAEVSKQTPRATVLTDEQPTTSKAAREMYSRFSSNNKQPQTFLEQTTADKSRQNLNSAATTALVYRKGKRGVCFQDDSSSSD